MSKIVSIATGLPSYQHQQQNICSFADKIYCSDEAESRKMKFLYRHSGINTRYSVIPDYSASEADRLFYEKNDTLDPFPGLEKRMEWFAAEAPRLSAETIARCIDGKINKNEVTHLITVSCTGLSAPGLDLEIMELMDLPGNIFRTSINFMGCYAAIHALKLADLVCLQQANANVVIVCTELCTLHFQKKTALTTLPLPCCLETDAQQCSFNTNKQDGQA